MRPKRAVINQTQIDKKKKMIKMANVIDKITFSLPTILVTVFIWCLLIIVHGPSEHGGGVAAWTNDILPKLKLKYGKRLSARWRSQSHLHLFTFTLHVAFV